VPPDLDDFRAVREEIATLSGALRGTAHAIEAIQRLAEAAVGILRNAATTNDGNIREFARGSYAEIVNQIGGLIDDSGFGGAPLIDGGAFWGVDLRFDRQLDFRGILPGVFIVEALNLNPSPERAIPGSSLQPLAALSAPSEASAYAVNADGDAAITAALSDLASYIGAIRSAASYFGIRAFEAFQADSAASDRFFFGDDGINYYGGADGAQLVYGMAGGDLLMGAGGNDVVFGGDGWDSLNGGGGRDVALFEFAKSDAVFSRDAAWSWNVAGGTGSDNLFAIEVALFLDGPVALREAPRSDVSGDGTSDLVWLNAAAGLVSYYEMNPAGGYVWRDIGAVSPDYEAFTGDFNGDGEADVMFYNGTSLSYYDVQAGGGYVWRNIGTVAPGRQAIVGDYDGDGTSDIALLDTTTGYLFWFDMHSVGGYERRDIGAVSLGFEPLTGDFNGDGKTDIAWFDGTTLGFIDIDPAGGYVWHDIGTVAPGHTALTGDFNNDGTTDVAFISQATNQISFYAVNPAGGYTWHNIGAVAPGYTATAADVTNDGKTDIVFTGNGSVSYYDVGPTGGYMWHNIGGVGAGYVLVA
jgi:hypothetical protein